LIGLIDFRNHNFQLNSKTLRKRKEKNMDQDARINAVIEKYQEYVNPGLAALMRFAGFGDVEVTAQGCMLQTASGEEYFDCLGGYGVFALGHRNPRVVAAVHRQLDLMPLSSRTFFNEPMANLAEKLASIAPGDLRYTFFSNSGAESVEAAIKIARIATGKTDFICTIGGFHGKSMGSLSATGREVFRKPFDPLVPGFKHVPFDDVDALAAEIDDNTAGIIVEPVQGEGGIIVPKDAYLPAVRELCNRKGILLILDEVQTGMGRTGYLFACQKWGVTPDIMTLAKALGGGVMPIGATMGTKDIWEKAFGENPLIHTSTFGGNPLACAAALAAIDTLIEENLADNARIQGEKMLQGLRKVMLSNPGSLKHVRGSGLMIGVEFESEDMAELSINGLARRGIIAAYTLNNPRVIRFEPPLIITSEQTERVVNAFGEAVAEAAQMLSDI
jgi:putrescine aminotransferase